MGTKWTKTHKRQTWI